MFSISGVIFDFNGTLFWDTHLHNAAWDAFLSKHQIQLTDVEKHQKIHGKHNKEILTSLFSADLSAHQIKALSFEKESIYQALCLSEKMELAPGSVDLFKFLMTHKIPFTIATASDLMNVEFYFEHLALDRFFNFSTVVHSDGKIKSKPHPEIFIKAMDVIGVPPDEVLIFEDSLSGIRAAENAQVKKIIIVNSNNDNYSQWEHEIIKDFSAVDRGLFKFH